MANRWECRAEPNPGQGKLHWHILFRDHPQVLALASMAQERLTHFSGLHFTPRQWLHMTTLIVGFSEKFTASAINDMITRAHQLLAEIAPAEITLGKIFYHPDGIVLGIQPDDALHPVFEAVQAATRIATGIDGITEHQPWSPHVTLAYSTSVQPASPIIAALGRELPSCQVTINRINLIVQEGAERLWNWRSIAEVPFGAD
jgi:2'-5' RNA ligase